MHSVKHSNGGKHVARRQKSSWVKKGRGRPDPRVTIDVLPDDVLLETFEFYLGRDHGDKIDRSYNYDEWQTLVHVCRRWRCIVFASPCRLDLKLYCTRQRSVNSKTLDIWPTSPTVVVAHSLQSLDDVNNIIAALRQHDRVCRIYCYDWGFPHSVLKEFAAIDEPFPALTSLELRSMGQNVPVLPDSFLGGTAPCLRLLDLDGIPFPSMGRLLLSTANLVRLSLWRIPRSGYISPEKIVPCLSKLSSLQSLDLEFQYPRSRFHREPRHLPPLTRLVLPNLTFLHFKGNMEYLEDVLSQIEAPVLNQSHFCFFNQLVFDTPLLGHFIRRTETFMTIHRACIRFFDVSVLVTLSGREEMAYDNMETLRLEITCKPLDWQLSAVSQVLKSLLSSLPTLESLEITAYRQGEIEVIQWRDLFHPFTSVKRMSLAGTNVIRLVAPALQDLAGEGSTEVLPALRTLFFKTYQGALSRPVNEAIKQFIDARQLHGHPVTIGD